MPSWAHFTAIKQGAEDLVEGAEEIKQGVLQRERSFMMYVQQQSNHFGGGIQDAAVSPKRFISTLWTATLATALFRCWHILLFYTLWATAITLINEKVTSLTMQTTLLTVVGTVLGFVISYRTTSSFERYNEGRRYWSQIILASRTLARAVWFHVPELLPITPEDEKENRSESERRARNIIEKKTVINLIEAFAVAVKHYLRGEEGINYVDLYHLVKFLPSYSFPAGIIHSEIEALNNMRRTSSYRSSNYNINNNTESGPTKHRRTYSSMTASTSGGTEKSGGSPAVGAPSIIVERPTSPKRVTISGETAATTAVNYDPTALNDGATSPGGGRQARHPTTFELPHPATSPRIRPGRTHSILRLKDVRTPATPYTLARFYTSYGFAEDEDVVLLPAELPPQFSLFDVFPFSMLIRCLQSRNNPLEGKKAARARAKHIVVTRNVPLEISMYLTSYVASLGASGRKALDVPTTNLLIATITQLQDALTGLERILTTPIPFSYSIHLWIVTIIYNLALPFQIYATLHWLTIPATAVLSFIFFGFLVAGEEIENPFGYDKNDLNMDHFTHNIIRNELRAMTAFPPPDPAAWAFSPANDCMFNGMQVGSMDGAAAMLSGTLTPLEWVRKGPGAIKDALAKV